MWYNEGTVTIPRPEQGTFTSPRRTMSPNSAQLIANLIQSIPFLTRVCGDPSVEQVIVYPNDIWLIWHHAEIEALEDDISRAGINRLLSALKRFGPQRYKKAWLLSVVEATTGSMLMAQRITTITDELFDEPLSGPLIDRLEAVGTGILVGPSTAPKSELLAMLAGHFERFPTLHLASQHTNLPTNKHVIPMHYSELLTGAPEVQLLRCSQAVFCDDLASMEASPYSFEQISAPHRWATMDAPSVAFAIANLAHHFPVTFHTGELTIAVLDPSHKEGQLTHVLWRDARGWHESRVADFSLLPLVQRHPTEAKPSTPHTAPANNATAADAISRADIPHPEKLLDERTIPQINAAKQLPGITSSTILKLYDTPTTEITEADLADVEIAHIEIASSSDDDVHLRQTMRELPAFSRLPPSPHDRSRADQAPPEKKSAPELDPKPNAPLSSLMDRLRKLKGE